MRSGRLGVKSRATSPTRRTIRLNPYPCVAVYHALIRERNAFVYGMSRTAPPILPADPVGGDGGSAHGAEGEAGAICCEEGLICPKPDFLSSQKKHPTSSISSAPTLLPNDLQPRAPKYRLESFIASFSSKVSWSIFQHRRVARRHPGETGRLHMRAASGDLIMLEAVAEKNNVLTET